MEVCIGVRTSQLPDVVGNMKIQRVITISIDLDILGIRSEYLESQSHLHWDFRLVCSEEDFDLESSAFQRDHVLGLDILKINQNEISFQAPTC